ncbi:MAG TPA: penicillin-binding transpeptidase domain-containing protein, partial [Pseudogracilibacillus sp.]|nr:penicillin-binding transpeptidase domain-containing protein [Pseudogracilibacillus sp.]
VVKKIVNPDSGEIIKEYNPEVVGEPIKAETAEKMNQLLSGVITGEGGTGAKFELEDYSAMGKTGTAQMPNPKGGGYLSGKENHIFSFLGMAPSEDPQLMIHVSVQQPKLKATEVGSDPVSYIFKNVMENSLRYLEIEPDKEEEDFIVESTLFPDILHKDVKEAENILKNEKIDAEFIGNGKKVAATNISANEVVFPHEKVIIATDKPTMPDITDWSKRDVLQLANLLNIELIDSGVGYATNQSIKSGSIIKDQKELKVKFEKPEINSD